MQIIYAINYRIIHPDTAPAIIHQAGVLQVGKMAGDRGLGKLEHILDIADAQLFLQEEAENTKTGFIGKSLENVSRCFHEDLIFAYQEIRLFLIARFDR
jgi:hypothetical protein